MPCFLNPWKFTKSESVSLKNCIKKELPILDKQILVECLFTEEWKVKSFWILSGNAEINIKIGK